MYRRGFMKNKNDNFERTASRVSVVSMITNIVLTAFKLMAGILGHSQAMVSDALHSLTDVAGSLIVLIGVRVSGKQADEEHPYGHERIECVASIILAGLLVAAGISIGSSGISTILHLDTETPATPGVIALAAAIVSIVVKESLFWYTWKNAKNINSGALRAEAWHHRSDALSSVGALIGIAGARAGLVILEPLASLVICLFIFKAAYDIFKEAIDKMVDHRCSDDFENSIRTSVLNNENVRSVDLLRTREFGRKVYVDLEIGVDGGATLQDAHQVAEEVHDMIEKEFPQVKHVMIHVNPAE